MLIFLIKVVQYLLSRPDCCILNFDDQHSITLFPAYIHTNLNMETDYLSWGRLDPECLLLNCIALAVCSPLCDVVTKWIVHGTLNKQDMGLSLSAASQLTMQHSWARCGLQCALPYQGVKLGLAKPQGGETLGNSPAWDEAACLL